MPNLLKTSSSLLLAMAIAITAQAQSTTNAASTAKQEKKKAPHRTAQSPLTPTVKNPEIHAKFLAQAKEGKCGVLFLGDSITAGWASNGKETWKRFAKYEPLNFGIGGDHTENVLWRITDGELDGIDPKAVVLLIGTNNQGQYKDKPEWVAAGVRKIIETIQAKHPSTKVILMALFPRSTRGSEVRKLVNATNEILKTYDNGDKVRYLDINQKFLDEKGQIPDAMMKDKLHPGAAGYEIWADALIPVLDDIVK